MNADIELFNVDKARFLVRKEEVIDEGKINPVLQTKPNIKNNQMNNKERRSVQFCREDAGA